VLWRPVRVTVTAELVTFAEPESLTHREWYWRSTGICVARHRNQGAITMTDLDPQTTADFWDAYITAANGRPIGHPRPIQLWNRPPGS
jgi:hypothetical protein